MSKEFEDINFKIQGRRKGAINSIEKMLSLLKKGVPLDLFRDSMGTRVILFGNETEALQAEAYATLTKIIDLMQTKRFILCEADKITRKVKLDDNVNVLIPKKSLIPKIYKCGVKDYVKYPKHNGYQSLHAVFRARAPHSAFIEIQVRTEEMHLNAEFLSANHDSHALDRYGERLHSKLDFSKVHIPGFRYLSNDLMYDDIGLQTSLLTFQRTKFF